jgi:ribosomal protein S18 acetylase RimI-like enzyme
VTRPAISVRGATGADRDVIADVLARAFIADPAMAYLFPDAARRPRRLQRFFAAIGRAGAVTDDWALALDAGGVPVAATIWRPPGAWQTPLTTTLRLLPRLLGTFGTALPRALALQNRLEAHHPTSPHWYLAFAGCVPAAQGRGYGGAAIRRQLALCDAQRLPAALETATPSNLGLYQALGFDITDSFAIVDGLTFWTMWRPPR